MPSVREHLTDPQRCWRRFTAGLVVFVAGAGLLLGVAQYHIVLYWLALGTLLIGFVLAMSGYLGLFIQRFSGLNEAKKRSRGGN